MIKLSLSGYERVALLPLIAASFFQVVDMMVVNPLGAWMVPELELSTTEFSLLLLAYNLVSALAGMLSAPLLDRCDRRLALFWSCLALALLTLLTSIASDLAEIVLLRGFAGACAGLIASQTLAMIGDLIVPSHRGRALGFVMSAFGIASALGVPLSLAIASQWGWRGAFIAVGAVGLLVAVFMLALPSVRPADAAPSLRERLAAAQDNGIALFALFCLTASAFVVIPFIGIFYTSHVGVHATELGLVYVVGGGVAAVFMARLGTSVDRFGSTRAFFWLAGLSLVSILMLTNLANLTSLANLGGGGLFAAMAASTLFFCLMTGRMLPLNLMLMARVPPSQRGSFMSLNVALQSLATAAGALAGGSLSSLEGAATGTFPINGMVSVALSFIAMAAVLTLRHPSRPN